jgi:hypothetical protein
VRVYSYDEHARVGDFTPADGGLRIYRRSVAPNRSAPLKGHYSTLDRKLAVLYRDGARLKFFLEGTGSITLSEEVTADWHLVTKNKAQLSFDTDPPVRVVYRSNYNRVIAHVAAAPHTTREDLDFGLYVSNVLKNEERRQRVYTEDVETPAQTPEPVEGTDD